MERGFAIWSSLSTDFEPSCVRRGGIGFHYRSGTGIPSPPSTGERESGAEPFSAATQRLPGHAICKILFVDECLFMEVYSWRAEANPNTPASRNAKPSTLKKGTKNAASRKKNPNAVPGPPSTSRTAAERRVDPRAGARARARPNQSRRSPEPVPEVLRDE